MKGLRTAAVSLSGAVIGAVFLWFALRSIDMRAVFAIVLGADKFDVLGIIICSFAFVGVKALRWSWLMRHLRSVSFERLIGPVFAGSAVNYGIPHGGELVRAWMVSRREQIPKAALLASIAVERLFDFCAALLLGLVALLAGRAVLDILGVYLWVLLAFVAVMLGAALPFVLCPAGALDVLRLLLEPLPAAARDWILRHVEHGIGGLGSLQKGFTLVKVFGLSVVQWALMAGCAWFSLRAVGIVPDPVLALVILLLLVVGLTLPAAPGHVGTTQIAFLLAAAPFGLGKEAAVAASLVYNVFVPAPLIVAGVGVLLCAWAREKRSVAHPGALPDADTRQSAKG